MLTFLDRGSSCSVLGPKDWQSSLQLHKGRMLQRIAKPDKVPGLSNKFFLRADDSPSLYMAKSAKERTIAQLYGRDYLGKIFLETLGLSAPLPDDPPLNAFVARLRCYCEQHLVVGMWRSQEEQHFAEYCLQPLETLAQTKGIVARWLEAAKTGQSKNATANAAMTLSHALKTAHRLALQGVWDGYRNHLHAEVLLQSVIKHLFPNLAVPADLYYPEQAAEQKPLLVTRFFSFEYHFEEFVQTAIHRYLQHAFQECLPHKKEALSEFLQQVSQSGLLQINGGLQPAEIAEVLPYLAVCHFTPLSPGFWEALAQSHLAIARPSLANLAFTAQQKIHLGVLYGMALITGHADVLNNIDGTNAGILRTEQGNQVAIVDGGGSLGVGFGGDLQAGNACQWEITTPGLASGSYITLLAEGCSVKEVWQGLQAIPPAIQGLAHTVPFCEGNLLPLLPRQLAPDLFDLNDPAIQVGLQQAVAEACAHQDAIPDAIAEAWAKVPAKLTECLQHTRYAPTADNDIVAVLRDRLNMLAEAITQAQGQQKSLATGGAAESNFADAFAEALLQHMQARLALAKQYWRPR